MIESNRAIRCCFVAYTISYVLIIGALQHMINSQQTHRTFDSMHFSADLKISNICTEK